MAAGVRESRQGSVEEKFLPLSSWPLRALPPNIQLQSTAMHGCLFRSGRHEWIDLGMVYLRFVHRKIQRRDHNIATDSTMTRYTSS